MMSYKRDTTYQSCCLEAIGEEFSVDLLSNTIPEDIMEYYEVEWYVPCAPYKFFGETITEEKYSCRVEVAHLENGKYAYPVYEVTPLINEFGDSDEGKTKLIGWCIKNNDAFASYKRKINYR